MSRGNADSAEKGRGGGLTLDWFVNPQTLADFHKRFKGQDRASIQAYSFQEGQVLGAKLIEELGIEGDNERAVAAVLEAVLRFEPTAEILSVEQGRVVVRNSGFCPLMTACASLQLPWEWMCEVLGWPFFHGLACAVNPKMDLRMAKRRHKGDPYCDHIFEIGEGRLLIE